MSGPYAPSPGLDLDQSRQTFVWVSILLPYILALITVVLRFTSRRIARKGSWFDDWLMALAMMLATGILAGTTTSIHEGLGLHIWVFPTEDIASHAQNVLLGLFELDNMYYACYGLAKMSVLALYYRTFHNRVIRRVIYIFILMVVLWVGVAICLTVLECSPVSGFWLDPLEAYCPIPRIPLHLNLSIASVVMNFIILCLPIPLFLDPEHTRLHRFILVLMFGFGLFVCVVSIIRTLSITYTDIMSIDLFWNLANVWAWTAVEVQLAIVAANLPTLGHVFARFVPSIQSDSLSPEHTGNSPLPRMRGSEKAAAPKQAVQKTNSRMLSLDKPLPPIDTSIDRYAEENGPWPDTPRRLPEREPVRAVDHGIAEWEYVPERPNFDARAAQYAHPGTPVAGRWNTMSGISAIIGARQERPTSTTWRRNQTNHPQHDSSQSQTLVTQQSPRNNTDSYASDAALLPMQHPNRSSSNVRGSDPQSSSNVRSSNVPQSPPLPPPATLSAARNQLRSAGGGQGYHEHPLRSSPSSDESSILYGSRSQAGKGSWYKRGTATTPEYDPENDDAIMRRVSNRYSGVPQYHVPYSIRYSAYGYGAVEEQKPPLRPRNPRRITTRSVDAYRPGASTPETADARELTVTRAGPHSGTTPTLLQGAFGHGTVPASVSRATGGGADPSPAPTVPQYYDNIPRSVPDAGPMPADSSSTPPTASDAYGPNHGHRPRGSLEEAEFATAQLSAFAQSPHLRDSGIEYPYYHDADAESDGTRYYEPELELPSLDSTPERSTEGRLRLPIRAPAPALEPQHHFEGGIHVMREVRVENERWSQIRERERLEWEMEQALEGSHEL